MFDGQFRHHIEAGLKPVGTSLRRAGVTADALTACGIAMSVAAAVSIGAGYLHLGLLFVILTGVPDLLDGAVAKASGTASARGAFFDSVSDRITDALLFGSLAWYFTTISDGQLPVLATAVGFTSLSVSYIRAKAEALGFDARGGLVERAERFILLGLGLLFHDTLLVAVLWLMLALNTLTIGQRFVKVWRQASAVADRPLPRRPRRRPRPTPVARRARAAGTRRRSERVTTRR